MSKTLIITLIIFSIIWFTVIFKLIRNSKLSIKYSMIWFFMSLVIFLVGITPNFMSYLTKLIGFETTSNFVVGIIMTLLLVITLFLTIIVTNQKSQINNLIQEVSILKSKHEDN